VLLLIAFALLAGAGTALSPCVLPVLPAVLAAGTTGGRRRPLGVVVGLTASFTFATVALVYVIDALGLPDDFTRKLAIVVLAAFGITLLLPPVSDRVEAFATRLTGGPRAARGEGFWSGAVLGASLGFVYAPCAGPILAGVITVSATQHLTAEKLTIALAYGAGTGLILYAILLGGRRLTARLAPVRGRVNAAMGALMLAVALMLATNADIRFETWLARNAPAAIVDPTNGLEQSHAVADELARLRGGHHFAVPAGATQAENGRRLPLVAPAPELAGTGRWFNGRPLSIRSLRGRVVLIDFWTYTCINCLRTLPHVEAWYERYRRDGLTVIGVHTPEFPFERIAGNVDEAIQANGLTYPVVQDNDYATWNAYGNQFWPAKYLIDATGHVRYIHFGEGAYGTTEKAIRSLLAERGARRLGPDTSVRAQVASEGITTPESYLGLARGAGFAQPPRAGTNTYRLPSRLEPEGLAFGGRWTESPEAATAAGNSSLELNFNARRVFLVLGSPSGPRPVRVFLDGRPLSPRQAGSDVHGGRLLVGAQRLYSLVDLPAVGRHTLLLRSAPGVSAYAFTFG
jgi:cytochrome c biogenesis protein CcdA/thiol-disulfide isomerase/thioredoxin